MLRSQAAATKQVSVPVAGRATGASVWSGTPRGQARA